MEDRKFSVIGQELPRVDALVKVKGQGRYVSDIRLPGMLHGKVLRSPFPHAAIRRIEVRRAERLPGVRAVVTAVDTPRKKFSPAPPANNLILQDEKVRYVGDPVAAVAAVDEDLAEAALDLITVEYEELPAVFDPEEAMKEGAPRIHGEENNVAARIAREVGDAERVLAESDVVVEGRFESPAVAHCCLEPRGCVAEFDLSGNLTVWSITQSPHSLREELALVLDLPVERIRVMRTHAGGGFGARIEMDPIDAIAGLLSKKSGKPVRIVNTREEEFLTSRTRYPMIIELKTGAQKDGRCTARQAKMIVDSGAYNNRAPSIAGNAGAKLNQLYAVPHVKFEAWIVYTNHVHGGAFRGYGNPQITFALESQMDEIAERLGLDPADIRLINANRPDTVTSMGSRIGSCAMSECIQEAVRRSGWRMKRKKRERNRGLGIAVSINSGSGSKAPWGGEYCNFSKAAVRLNGDGTTDLFSGSAEIGQGSDTVLAQIAAEELGILFSEVRVLSGDTAATPPCCGARGSRQTFIAGNAVRAAAADAKRQLLEVAADLLEARLEDLEAKEQRIFVRGSPGRFLSVAQAAEAGQIRRGGPILGIGSCEDPWSDAPNQTGFGNPSSTYAAAAHVAEVEVDEKTGRVYLERVTTAHDVGRTINPLGAKGQVVGGILSMGLGYALTEHLVMENGKVLNTSFLDYKIPTALESCDVETIFIESLDPHGPFGAKGLGEPAMIAVAAAISNAVYDATGLRIRNLPLTAEKIYRALKAKPGGGRTGS